MNNKLMRFLNSLLTAAAAATVANAQGGRIAPPDYNGYIENYIADLAPGYPCHPLYENSKTWFDGDTSEGIRNILEGLALGGFNGIRLPMWPDSNLVRGADPRDDSEIYSR
jgi:hypothetical protein